MINEAGKNPELSFDQLQAIDVVQKRLSNLEAEISIAQKNLLIEKKEVVKATKEREYQEELLGKLNAEIPVLEAKKEKLESDISIASGALNQYLIEDRELKAKQAQIADEQNKREIAVREGEARLASQTESLRKEISDLKAEKARISDFKEALSAVIKTW